MNIMIRSKQPTIKKFFFSCAIIAFLSSSVKMTIAAQETGLEKIDAIMANLTLEEKVGQMFMVDFRTYNGAGVTELNPDITAAIRQYTPGGIILFAENTVETLQTKHLVEDLQRSSPKLPLFIAVDQEGGAVVRLKYATITPGNMALGATNDKRLTYRVANAIGKELKVLGINMNFAPVIDINNNPANPVIGARSFSDNPEIVTELGLQFIKGLNDAGIISAVKHFPGHGDTGVDSHIDLPLVPHDLARLESIELYPYRAAIHNNIDMIMTAHVTFPAIDDREGIPATLSSKCLTTLLREKMGFSGVIITDAMSMKAITERFGNAQAVELAIKAGADMVLMPQQIETTLPYIIGLVRDGSIPLERINDSVRRILTLKLKRGILEAKKPETDRKALKIVAGKSNLKLKQKAAAKAVTLVKNTAAALPLKPKPGQTIAYFAPTQKGAETVAESIHNLTKTMRQRQITVTGFNYENLAKLSPEQQQAIAESNYIILFTRTANSKDMSPETSYIASFAAELVTYANSNGKTLVAVAIRNPYDIQFMPEVKTYITAYSDWSGGGVEAALRLIFGKIKPSGKLPVAIPDKNGAVLYPNGFVLK